MKHVLAPEKAHACVVNIANSLAIARNSRLALHFFSKQCLCSRVNQRFPNGYIHIEHSHFDL